MHIKKHLNFKIILIFFSIILLIFARYNGNYHSDYKYIWLFLDGNLENDIYENNSILLSTSIIFYILDYLNFSLDNDLLGFSIHLILSIFAGIYLYKILKKIIPNASTQELLFLVFSLATLDSMIVNTAKSSWIGHHTMVPSHFGLAFFFFYFWHVLNNHKNFISILTLLFILISPRTAWFPCLFTFFYFLIPNFKIKDILWSFPSIILGLIYLYFNFDIQNLETKKLLFQRAIDKEQEEIVFHLQSSHYLISMFLSYVFYLYFLKFLNYEFKKLFKTIFYSTIFIFIFGLLYGLYGINFYPDPKILSLSPVRAMYVYQLCFVIIYFVFVKKNFEDIILRYSFFLFPLLYCLGVKGKILILLILIILAFYKLNFINKLFKLSNFDFTYAFIILILLISINSTKNRIDKFDSFTFKKISHWSTHMGDENNKFKEFFFKIRNCEDFILYDSINHPTSANFFSNKSKYFSKTNLNVAFDKKLYDEHFRRENIIKKIQRNKIHNLENFKSENFLYLADKSEKIGDKFFYLEKEFGNLIFYFEDNYISKLKKKCKFIFK
jgi:hypothetical protein